MPDPFFILSLPRSRSAWLANLLTTDRSWCGHDCCSSPLGFFKPPAGYTRVGAIGSDLAMAAWDLPARYPRARFAVLVRDLADIKRSIQAMPYPVVLAQLVSLRGDVLAFAEAAKAPVYDYAELDNEVRVRELWEWAFQGDVLWRPERFELLRQLNVQVQRTW